MLEKEKWINWIKEELQEISDKEFQERVWVNGQGSEMSSYIEVMNRLFDDKRFNEFIDKAHLLGLNHELIKELSELSGQLENYNDKNKSHAEIVKDIKWGEIRDKAKLVLQKMP